jgi:hypothetical protein
LPKIIGDLNEPMIFRRVPRPGDTAIPRLRRDAAFTLFYDSPGSINGSLIMSAQHASGQAGGREHVDAGFL